jgi:hypothetical protein
MSVWVCYYLGGLLYVTIMSSHTFNCSSFCHVSLPQANGQAHLGKLSAGSALPGTRTGIITDIIHMHGVSAQNLRT